MCCTSLPRVPPVVVRGLKFWAVKNFLPRPTPFPFFSASCHVYKSTVARLKLDINANNIVCFTGDHFLTGFGRDQAVKRCVTGPLRLPCVSVKKNWAKRRRNHIDTNPAAMPASHVDRRWPPQGTYFSNDFPMASYVKSLCNFILLSLQSLVRMTRQLCCRVMCNN